MLLGGRRRTRRVLLGFPKNRVLGSSRVELCSLPGRRGKGMCLRTLSVIYYELIMRSLTRAWTSSAHTGSKIIAEPLFNSLGTLDALETR